MTHSIATAKAKLQAATLKHEHLCRRAENECGTAGITKIRMKRDMAATARVEAENELHRVMVADD